MRITAEMLKQLGVAIASDAAASIVVLPKGHYIEVYYNKGRDMHRKQIEKVQFEEGPGKEARVREAWDAFVEDFVKTIGNAQRK